MRGEAVYDTYAREVVIMGRDILRMSKIERMDGSEAKRIELHCHTTMSAMDGVTSVSKLIEKVLDTSGYIDELQKDSKKEEAEDRIENLKAPTVK